MRASQALHLCILQALLCAGIWSVVYVQAPLLVGGPEPRVFAVLDVGQGDALYLRSPTGVEVLVDGGPDRSVLRALSAVMRPLDRSLDAVVATHPDADHIAGLLEVLEGYEAGSFFEPGIAKDTQVARALEERVEALGIPRYLARRGMSLNLGGGAHLDLLFPDYDVSRLPSDKANEGGVVARLRYGEASALLMADVGKGVERRLLVLEGAALRSELLKVAHHGSKNSSDREFVAAVAPELAVVSSGAGNSYGHPAAATLQTLASLGIPLLRTDEEGTLTFVSAGGPFVRRR